MFWADTQVGLPALLEKLEKFSRDFPNREHYQLSFLLRRCVDLGVTVDEYYNHGLHQSKQSKLDKNEFLVVPVAVWHSFCVFLLLLYRLQTRVGPNTYLLSRRGVFVIVAGTLIFCLLVAEESRHRPSGLVAKFTDTRRHKNGSGSVRGNTST
jgi:hypothetical protein